ncbi:restriction endonuclease subunit S [Bradyrhizobium sp. Arg68]|uniref:restriction endonuclease subunit S n=1 Tax=Bradyrhizobium ivorense TaxID=2511166 RepID=UPI0027E26316|nr:restriction endonuclease subunit S [Bradyrhizobium ivorense]MCC8935914.1 restriction endonuclease subunit S [Bradyrhizobium ivorense]
MNSSVARLATLAASKPYALVGGPFGSKLTSADYLEEGVPVIRGSNLSGGRYLDETNFVYVSEQKVLEDLSGNLAGRGDVVFTQRGTLGQVAIIPDDSQFDTYVISQSQMKLSVDPQKANARFIYYYFSSRDAIRKIINRNSSSGVPHINLTTLRNFPVPVPALREQQRIADILSAYDDLIENNRRRMALLKEAARMLYREWFVHFRFPGHEHFKIVGGLPDRWERRKLGNILTLKRGYDLPEAKRVSGEIPILSSSGVTGFHNQHKAPGPGVVTGRYGTLGEVYFIEEDYWPLNTALYVRDFKGSHPLFIFHLLTVLLKGIIAQKAAVPGVDRNVLHTMTVIWPPSSLRNSFVESVSDYQDQLRVLGAMNQKLAHARDLLLPRLMSGEIAV